MDTTSSDDAPHAKLRRRGFLNVGTASGLFVTGAAYVATTPGGNAQALGQTTPGAGATGTPTTGTPAMTVPAP